MKYSTSSSRLSSRTSASFGFAAVLRHRAGVESFDSAASRVASSSGAPPIAVSFAAAPGASSAGVAAADAWVRMIIGPRMPFTSW